MSEQKVVVFNLQEVSTFLRAAARAIATMEYTKMSWVEYRDSKVLNVIYTLMPWKGHPGWMEVQQDTNKIVAEINVKHKRFMATWMEKTASGGAAAGIKYLQGVQNIMNTAEEHVKWVFSEVSRINNEVIGETNAGIRNLARIKLASAVTVTVLGAGSGLGLLGLSNTGNLVVTGIGIADGVSHSVIKNWDSITGAEAVAIDAGKSSAQTAVGMGLDYATQQAINKAADSKHLASTYEGMIRRYSERAANEALKQKARINAANTANKMLGKLEEQRRLNGLANTSKIVTSATSKSLTIIFAGKSLLDSFADYNQTIRSTR